jgi:hypothetical protein
VLARALPYRFIEIKNIMTSLLAHFKKSFLLVAVILITSHFITASAQNTNLNSRVAVVTNESKTNIWVSDFPKKTSVIITDNEDNLLSIISTNDFGAAYVSLPTRIKTTVIVKTLNGEIEVSNKAVIKNKQEEQTVVSNKNTDLNKA